MTDKSKSMAIACALMCVSTFGLGIFLGATIHLVTLPESADEPPPVERSEALSIEASKLSNKLAGIGHNIGALREAFYEAAEVSSVHELSITRDLIVEQEAAIEVLVALEDVRLRQVTLAREEFNETE